MKLTYSDSPESRDIEFLTNGIMEDNKKRGELGPYEKFSLMLHSEDKALCGGCYGFIYFGSLHIDKLYIIEPLQYKGLGLKLVHATEELAKQKDCRFITVNTMDWQATGFYEKAGFKKEFVRLGYMCGHSLHWYRKDL